MHDRFAVGASASLHLGWLVRDRRLVCVKRMHPFHRAADRPLSVTHPNVVGTLGIVRRPGELLAAMEYVPGASLAEMLEATPTGLDARIASAIVSDVLRGLHAIHETRLAAMPRGLSPSSILVGEDGRARLLDLDVQGPSTAGAVVDKLPYAAPEQIDSSSAPFDVRRDVWAAGVVLWETLTGRSLFRAPTVEATLHAIRSRAIIPIVPELDPIVAASVTRDPDERYGSAEAMALELGRTSCASPDEVARVLATLDLRCIRRRKVLADAVHMRERRSLHIECNEGASKA